MVPATGQPLAAFTTMHVGGPACELVHASTEQQLVDAARAAWAADEPWLVLGGGSNVVIADDGFEGTVLRVETCGIQRLEGDGVRLRVQAGEAWDALVAFTVEHGWAGIEALSGIPGTVGAAPVQNIGAYGQELAQTLVAIDLLDQDSGELVRVPAAQLELGYRTSSLKRGRRGVVVAIELALAESAAGTVAYPQLAQALGVGLGERVPLDRIRAQVLALRASKGMVLDAADPDTASCGSFFTNPIVTEAFARTLPPDAPRWSLGPQPHDVVVPLEVYVPFPERATFPELVEATERDDISALRSSARPDDRSDRPEPAARARSQGTGAGRGAGEPAPRQVKLSAAWLIERAGIGRGFALPGSRAAISSKHTLAITNRGGATAAQIAELARFVRARVSATFGVELQPEPVGVGVEL